MNKDFIMVEAGYFCKIHADAEGKDRASKWYSEEVKKNDDYRAENAALKAEIEQLKADMAAGILRSAALPTIIIESDGSETK